MNNPETKEKTIALAGNPNVGKSTVFNALTGMHQHTGNWSGKTVDNAEGFLKNSRNRYRFVDIPGTYSLLANSPEEEIARDFICFGQSDTVVVVCDATCLEKNLNLVLQTIETEKNVVVCVNLLDEGAKKGIKIDLDLLSAELGVAVVGVVAKRKKSLKKLLFTLQNEHKNPPLCKTLYPEPIENAIKIIEKGLESTDLCGLSARWVSLQLLQNNLSVKRKIFAHIRTDLMEVPCVSDAVNSAYRILEQGGITDDILTDIISLCFISRAEKTAKAVTTYTKRDYRQKERKIDRIITSKKFGYPIMLLMLLIIFWITISGANYLSDLLSRLFATAEKGLTNWFDSIKMPCNISNFILEGILRVPLWVVSVMLPPMAIFFPLFTLLEDAGFLPRIAFNLDKPLSRCGSCGKQALTMCMGFGCNAAGVVGCRIIDSKRERLLAILTNSLVPCNGRFPQLIAIITMFLMPFSLSQSKVLSAAILTATIFVGVLMTLFATKLLSKTVIKGVPSSYILELPPYRRPQILKVLFRSFVERTLFVLGRALTVAIPAGIVLFIFANTEIGGVSLLAHTAAFLDPLGQIIGLDGVILTAFILGLPANEIVLPIILMTYLSHGALAETPPLYEMQSILSANGWSVVTAICVIVFTLFHWPCSTTVLTIKKETGSLKWTAISVALPTAIGVIICFLVNLISKII